MGRPKALLPVDGVRFIEKIVTALKSTRVDKIIVVLGHNVEEMRRKIRTCRSRWWLIRTTSRDSYRRCMVAIVSIQSSKDSASVDGILVHLVDHPYINAGFGRPDDRPVSTRRRN